MNVEKLNLSLHGREYPIIIGKNILNELRSYIPKNTSNIVVFADDKLPKMTGKLMEVVRASGFAHELISVTAGEALKKFDCTYQLMGKLIDAKADRNSLIIALGGGTVGDSIGFIASTYMRGIPWFGVATTLLSQVDSSVGGKTGVNHEKGKNLIGSFHQPSLVVCDTEFLSTLSERELISGIGEIVKYSLTFDLEFFNWLEANLSKLVAGSHEEMNHAIVKSLAWKCEKVSQDEFDRAGVREVLNFGHTFGHAIEAVTDYGMYQHGEAVILGMQFAIELSVIRKWLTSEKAQRIQALLNQLPVRVLPTNIAFETFASAMKKDKKSEAQKIRFVLLKDIGSSVSDKEVTPEELNTAFKKFCKLGR